MHKQLTNLSHNQSVIIIPTKTHILIRIYTVVKVHIYLDYVRPHDASSARPITSACLYGLGHQQAQFFEFQWWQQNYLLLQTFRQMVCCYEGNWVVSCIYSNLYLWVLSASCSYNFNVDRVLENVIEISVRNIFCVTTFKVEMKKRFVVYSIWSLDW